MTPLSLEDRTRKFHDHLDRCVQCREHPLELCPVGRVLILGTALKVVPPMFLNPKVQA